jgi:hypothetical protein
MSHSVRVTKRKPHITLTTVTSLHFLTFTFWNYYVLKLLRLETVTFSDAMLSDINVVLCCVLSQYLKNNGSCRLKISVQKAAIDRSEGGQHDGKISPGW